MQKISALPNQYSSKKSLPHFFAQKRQSFFKPFIQPRLIINPPNDVYEQEADAMADKVMRMKDSEAGNDFFFKPAISPVQRKCAHCEMEEKKQLQRKKTNNPVAHEDNELDTYVEGLSGGGQFLPKEVRSFFEPRMGYDFSNVKVHTDAVAAKSAQSINAWAYTAGNDIVFNNEQFSPHTDIGKKLLAHELTHVAQQKSGLKMIQRMAPCPAHLNDNDPVPVGWRLYPGPTAVFHCGFRTILENRAPTRDDPMNECVFDHSGVLVDDTHPYAGCKGTPDQYDSSAGALSWLGHATIDSGGVVRQGAPAFITSRVYDISTAIASGIEAIANTSGAISGTLRAITNSIGNALVLSILTSRAISDPGNWTYSVMPDRSRRHLNLMGAIISSISLNGNINNLMISLTKPLRNYPISDLLVEIAADTNIALSSKGDPTTINATDIGQLSLFQFVEWLKGKGLISYNRAPEEIARKQMQQTLQAQP